MLALTGLFLAALVAATLLPAQSELVLAGLLLESKFNPILLIAVASVGNVLGSVINWTMGRFLMRFSEHRWFPFSERQINRARAGYQRYGWWSLFASWMPIIGDPLTFIAGAMKEPIWRFLLVVTLAKAVRYIVLVLAIGAVQ